MNWRSLGSIIFATGALLAGPHWTRSAWNSVARAADVEPADLKSDLEIEIDGVSEKKAKRHRKPAQPKYEAEPEVRPHQETSKPVDHDRISEMDARIEQAQRLYDAKKYKEAVELLRPYNDILPRAGLLLMARSYGALGDALNELKMLELCLAKNPKDYVVKTVYGQALIHVKRIEDGIMALQEARQMNPRYRPAYDALIKELEIKGERYEARNVVNDMIKIFGPQGAFLTTLCRLYAVDSYHEKSVEICEEALSKDPSVPENHMYLGLALKERENLDRANHVLSQAIRRFPKSEPVQYAMGELSVAKKDHVRAYRFFRSATQADPKSTRAWLGFANAAFEIQKNEEALKAYINACKLDRQQTKDFRVTLGKIRVRRDFDWQLKFENGINQCQ